MPNLEEYEGAVVGMHISEGSGRDPGLPGAFGGRRDSSRLADLMLRMQTRFLDEIGLRERQADEGGEQQQAPADQGKGKSHAFQSKWGKLALGLIALCGLMSLIVLVLFFEGGAVRKQAERDQMAADAMNLEQNKLRDMLEHEDYIGKCPKYEQVFLSWLSTFCKFINCTSELCHKHWTPFAGHCYYFSKSALDWEASRQSCVTQGSELLVVRSRKEQKFVASHDEANVYWIGLTEDSEQTLWKWVDGNYLRNDLNFWDKDYPDNYFDYEMEDFKNCAVVRDGSWANAACNQANYWICKRRSEKPPVTL